MKQLILIVAILCQGFVVNSQPMASAQTNEHSEAAFKTIKWLAHLYEFGVTVNADSMSLSAEVQTIINDQALRDALYPETYRWEPVVTFLEQKDYKKSFWYFINLYPENKEQVLQLVLGFDKAIEMDRALLAALYTYAFVDPEVCTITDGKPVINRPDLAEKKLDTVNEMIQYVMHYREQGEGQGNLRIIRNSLFTIARVKVL